MTQWEASFSRMCKIHTHTHKAYHKYAFVPLPVETGPGNILNVTLYIFISLSLALCGRREQQEARDHQFMKKWKNMLLICSTFLLSARRQKDDKCESGWRRVIHWSRTDRWWDRERGELGREAEREKSDGTCSFIRPFTPVATATCLEGTQERRHH